MTPPEAWRPGCSASPGSVPSITCAADGYPPCPWKSSATPDNRDPGTLLADRDSLRRALDELPEAQRQAIELAYFGDLTQREIAEHLHIPLGTIKARTARGLHRLQTLLVAA